MTPAARVPDAERRNPRTGAIVAVLLVVAAGARVAAVLATMHMPLINDPSDYQRLAVSLVHGHGFGRTVLAAGGGPTAFRPPAYPLFLAGIYAVAGVHVLVARLVEAVLGVVTVGLLGLLARELLDRRAALIVLGIAAVYPPLILFGVALVSEAVFLPIELAILLLVVWSRRRGARWSTTCAAGGALAGLAALDRTTGAVLVVVVALLAMLAGGSARDRLLLRPALVVACALLVLSPWIVRNEARFHRFLPLGDFDGYALSGVYNPLSSHGRYAGHFIVPLAVPSLAPLFHDRSLNEVQLSEALRRRALDYIRAHPGYVGTVGVANSRSYLGLAGRELGQAELTSLGYPRFTSDLEMASFFVLGALALAGVFTARVRRTDPWFWVLPMVGFTIVTVFVDGTARYRAPIEPFVVLAAAAALAGASESERWRGTRFGRRRT